MAQGWFCVVMIRTKNCVPSMSMWYFMGRIFISECKYCMESGAGATTDACNAQQKPEFFV